MESLEARIVELEIKTAFQEDLLETLNGIVTRQEQQIDLLQKQFKALYQQMLSQGPGGNDGNPRVVEQLSSATGKANQVFTPLAIFDVTPEGLVMREVAQGVSALDVQLQSATPLLAADDLKVVTL